ncbi:MAG: hypothetical protein GY814_17535 [Gammaproteobacteria bacterium]|nr:hypothetical protein [Gammaproteobacteria bacterium]
MKKMTTLNILSEAHGFKTAPTTDGSGLDRVSWEKLLASLGKTQADDAPLSFGHLLDVLGIVKAIYCLETLEAKERRLFRVDLFKLAIPASDKAIEAVFVKHFVAD